MIDIPPIEWPTRMTLPFGASCAMTLRQVVAELVDGRVLTVRSLRASVRALVVEDHPVLAAERLALEVPAVEVEREAVHEHECQGRAVRSLAVGVRRDLVDLRMQHQAVVAGDGDRVRVQGTQPVGLGGPRPACAHHAALDRHPGRDSGQGRAPRPPAAYARERRVLKRPLPRPRRGSAGHPCG